MNRKLKKIYERNERLKELVLSTIRLHTPKKVINHLYYCRTGSLIGDSFNPEFLDGNKYSTSDLSYMLLIAESIWDN